ncbi:primosomal protein N' [Liquorilactobacillus oeni]|uniref:primosomal protein N' n=1 Tax=Liquorilactobacillus oeni TaxID=303241 RepID=UPI0009F9E0FF|nr:primosomal protein N' [Liquorilactobacillus oeni]
MTQYAEVIVDVPTMQTNRPYTYKVKKEFENEIDSGMRVVVPFGRGSRLVQGFVMRVFTQNSFEGSLKEITALIDFEPVLNTESLELAKWMARNTFSFAISCLQTMLPGALRAKYQKELVLIDGRELSKEVSAFFNTRKSQFLDEQKVSADLLTKLLDARKKGKVKLNYLVNDRLLPKKVIFVKSILSKEQLEAAKKNLRANAANLKKMLDYLIRHSQEVQQTILEKKLKITAQTLHSAEKRGWIKRFEKVARRNPVENMEIVKTHPRELTVAQKEAVTAINADIDNENAITFLLEGVTGSGKTEVYLQAIAHVLAKKKTALMLVPEISLTPQMVKRVIGRFGTQVALFHSGLSAGERFDEWRRIKEGKASVVVGARSAVFTPLENIGVIIMDEEHESSYKQEKMPRYHARDVAKWRADYHNCPVILGSATPSLESRARAQKGVYRWLKLPQRINNRPLPAVSLIDMRQEAKKTRFPDFSQSLLDAITVRLEKKEQTILMLNRRGYSSFMMCRDCGYVLNCPNCDISLTLHLDTHSMKCHYCGHEEKIPYICPACGSKQIRYYGTGTQKVEKELRQLFPQARILRMDVDTTRRKGAHESILRRFGERKADILLGTQMIAKGLDYPEVTLVGVLNADTALGMADFRASERTFQLLTQVSGRAGRAQKEGKVIIQTYNPNHYALLLAQKQDYEEFFNQEMNIRHRGGYPPYFFTIQVTASALDEGNAAKKIFETYTELKKVLGRNSFILGPTPKAIMRINNRYYYQLIIKYKKEPKLNACLHALLQKSQRDERAGVMITIDKEPLNFI